MKHENLGTDQGLYEKYPLFATAGEVAAHARKTIAPDKILLQKAGGKNISVGKYLDTVCRVCNIFLEMGIEKNCKVGVFLSNSIEYTYLYTTLGLLGAPMVP